MDYWGSLIIQLLLLIKFHLTRINIVANDILWSLGTNFVKSYIFVAVQIICIGFIVMTGPNFASNVYLLTIELLGIGLGIWAISVMGIGNFNITPDLRKNSKLITSGPYKLIRHPMYTAVLITMLSLVISHFTPLRLAIWTIFLIDLVLKLKYEEKLLSQTLKGYPLYKDRSSSLIPFIY